MIPYEWLEDASLRIAPHIIETPLVFDTHPDLGQVYLKWENHQVTGSFKARGALNKILTLQPWERQLGLVTASAGNHGLGVAMAGKLVGAAVTVFVSEHAVPRKVQAIRELGASIQEVPGGYPEAERAGIEAARRRHLTWISPYNDEQIIAGQGTIGLEILAQQPEASLATWIVPAGGGGLISGIGLAIKNHPSSQLSGSGRPRLIGVQPEASPFLHSLYHHGTQDGIIEQETLADGLAGQVEDHSLTIPLARELVDDMILVSEMEIIQAIRFAWQRYGEPIEGSAAVSLAAILSGKVRSRPAMLIISGGNIQPEVHARIVGI